MQYPIVKKLAATMDFKTRAVYRYDVLQIQFFVLKHLLSEAATNLMSVFNPLMTTTRNTSHFLVSFQYLVTVDPINPLTPKLFFW